MTATRRQTVFAGLDQPGTWPPTPRALRPQRLELGLDSLPGVAATTQRKLGKLGLATVRDVLEHRPRRYETAADEVAIAALREGEEVVVCGRVLNVEKRPDARAAADADRRAGRRRHGGDQRHLVQPALARRPPAARHGGSAARQARPLRLRAALVRHRRRGARDRRLRSGLPGRGGDRGGDGAPGGRRCACRSRSTSRIRCRPSCASAKGWR